MIDRVLAGRYKIVSSLGEGGMARVWRAQDLNTGKYVAVKVLREEYHDDEVFVHRFEREAQAASRMTHPNIVNLLDVGVEPDGTRYLVIEFVSGKTLKQFIQESGALRPDIAAQIIIRVLAAVQHAHQNGVIHRDIKPQNILIDKEGTVKVSDFGIARVANAQTTSQDTETVMGSVYYFSPEQAKGATVDEKSDLYSVGAVFYEMLTGQVPFTGETPVAIAMKHLQQPPVPPSRINPAVSPALDYVVLHALEKKPRNRYASAADMLRDVRLALEHPDTILAARAQEERREREARAARKRQERTRKRVRWMRRALVGLFSLGLLVVIALLGYTVTSRVLDARQNTVEVPNFIGKDWQVAAQEAEQAGLQPYLRFDEMPLVPENLVADQGIAPGTFVRPGTTITIIICQSQYDLVIPAVTNLSLAAAQTTITEMGLTVGEVREVPDKASENMVIGQVPQAGTPAYLGDRVDLTISAGIRVMPNLVGMTRAEAEQTLIAYGLPLQEARDETVDDPELVGRVTGQTPTAYAEIAPSSSVVLTIGVASSSLYQTTLLLELSDVPEDAFVSVSVINESGSEFEQYWSTLNGGDITLEVPVYSASARTAEYIVYINGEETQRGEVTFQ